MQLDDIAIDFQAARGGERPMPTQVASITLTDLRGMTREIYDRLDAASTGARDVVFIPDDPEATEDEGGVGWNLAHVVVHLTAGLEENAVQASTLARGAEITGRPRYETPWEEVTTAGQVRHRLAESRRITLALLDTWPDAPHLDTTHAHPFFGTMDAVSYHALGLVHARGHLPQLAEIRRQDAGRPGA